MADINVPILGKTSSKAVFVGAIILVSLIAFYVYQHASVTQTSNTSKPRRQRVMVSNPSGKGTHWEYYTIG